LLFLIGFKSQDNKVVTSLVQSFCLNHVHKI
jgi:hypothetical protein